MFRFRSITEQMQGLEAVEKPLQTPEEQRSASMISVLGRKRHRHRSDVSIVPKRFYRLSEYKQKEEIDSTGFTVTEKTTLRNAMRTIEDRFRLHAYTINVYFFCDRYDTIAYFRLRNGRIDIKSLSHYALKIMTFYRHIISDGFDDPPYMHTSLIDMIRDQLSMKIPWQEVEAVTEAVNDYILFLLKKFDCPTLVAALKKLSNVVVSYFREIYD